METYIPISFLNDFVFCPRSIYFHQLHGEREQLTYQEKAQIQGKQAHKSIDAKTYSTRKSVLHGVPVYSERFRLHGKIDLFDEDTGMLVERKKRIKVIYNGYVFQLYAQYHCLTEMGYEVKKLSLYSMDTNKSYPVSLPHDNQAMQDDFEKLVEKINSHELTDPFQANPQKCRRCIYVNLCDQRADLC